MAIFFICNKFVHFSFLQTLQFMEKVIHQISYVPDCKEQNESHPHFTFHCKLLLKPPYISKLINLNYAFKISLSVIIIGTKSQFHNGIHLKILFILIIVFLRHFTYSQRREFYEGKNEKVKEISNFKYNHASHINKIRDTAIELGSRDSFLELDFCAKSGSKKYKDYSNIYMVNHLDLFLFQMSYMNT